MPELPEVEVIRQGLRPKLRGKSLQTVDYRCAKLRYPIPTYLEEQLSGLSCQGIKRRGKYLLFNFENKQLAWHLGMTGQFRLVPPQTPFAKHEHIGLNFSDNISLRYKDTRRFGYLDIIKEPINTHPWFKKMGVEPLSDDFNTDSFYAQCQKRRVAIKTLIMDANTVVGIGNIYAAESLFRAGIHPAAACASISKQRIGRWVDISKAVLEEAISVGGSSISDFIHVDGKQGYFSHQFKVYGRHQQPCYTCQQPIQKITQTGRSTFFCASCQS
ncbi:MAG: bifunctional DNA-formamidopyrimidine glycosylase/DNA-(apurinic or apyrimidinic site) lyase [Mariprofundaceae bacterium]|nr:bifunctional DNA-formamidopyrimidine glycosylase/DNA-(apurinic or apyrimidinic site) lyase [Mariprofundaceae bacterium]